MLLPMIKTHDGLKNSIETFSFFLLHDPLFCGFDVIICPNSTKILISQVLIMENLPNPSQTFGNLITQLSLKWKYRLVGHLGEF